MRNIGLILALCLISSTFAQEEQWDEARVDGLMKELSNWGKWGKDDQRGTLNYISPKTRKAAVKCVIDGVSISLSRNAAKEKAADNGRPYKHDINAAKETSHWVTDSINVACHGLAHTHVDALCHKLYKGKMYNGFSWKEITDKGAQKNSVISMKNGILARGILVDIPLLKGVDYLEAGTAIMPSDLDAWEKKTGLKIGEGDVVVVRTGHWKRRAKEGVSNKRSGLHVSCMPWLHKRKIAMIGTDIALDVAPSGVKGSSHPVHLISLVAMGMPVLDCAFLEEVAIAATKRERWKFLISIAPLAVDGATGTPVNPIATF